MGIKGDRNQRRTDKIDRIFKTASKLLITPKNLKLLPAVDKIPTVERV